MSNDKEEMRRKFFEDLGVDYYERNIPDWLGNLFDRLYEAGWSK